MLNVSRLLTPLLAVLALAACGGPSHHQSAGGSIHPPGWGGTPKGVILPRPELFAAVPTQTMFDTTDCTFSSCSTVPARPFAAAGYTSGHWVTFGPLRHAFPLSHVVSIAVTASNHADCLDDEPGDAAPWQAGAWAAADIHAGFAHPCVYSDLSQMSAVKASLAAKLGSHWRARVFLWLAWYRFVPGLVSGYDAVQYSDHCLGRNLDCSTVSLAFLRIAHPPYAPPKPKPRPKPKPGCDKRCHQQRALTATRRAITGVEHGLAVNHCRRPYRRDVCVDLGREILPALERRERYFAQLLK